MKKFKDKKYFRPAVIAGAIAVVLGVLHLLGFRITFIEPNWDAISAWAAWVGVAASFIAIWFTIQIPKKIADRQDKVALFEKRFDCYMTIQYILEFAKNIKDKTKVQDIESAWELEIMFQRQGSHGVTLESILSYFQHSECLAMSGQFLFDHYDCTDFQGILYDMVQFLIPLYSPERNSAELSQTEIQQKNTICQKCEQFREKYLFAMENEMNLKK